MNTYRIEDIRELRIHGRTRFTKEGLPLFWTASGIELNIKAPELSLTYQADYALFEPWVDILIDGVRTQRVMLQKGTHTLPIYRGGELVRGEPSPIRRVQVLRDTPSMPDDPQNTLLFLSLSFEGEVYPLPETTRRLLFIGDSITSGEGGCGALHSDTWDSGCFDAVDNYAFFTASALSADYQVLSQSGWGVYCDFLGNTGRILPPFEGQVCGLLSGSRAEALGALKYWDASLFSPDAIIINLGTNDLSGIREQGHLKETGALTEEGLAKISDAAYAFLSSLHSRYPSALLLWCYGMLEAENPLWYSQMEEMFSGAVSRFQREHPEGNAIYLTLPPTRPGEYGSRSHPGHLSHLHASQVLTRQLQALLPSAHQNV